jgi:hypothetical protein
MNWFNLRHFFRSAGEKHFLNLKPKQETLMRFTNKHLPWSKYDKEFTSFEKIGQVSFIHVF